MGSWLSVFSTEAGTVASFPGTLYVLSCHRFGKYTEVCQKAENHWFSESKYCYNTYSINSQESLEKLLYWGIVKELNSI